MSTKTNEQTSDKEVYKHIHNYGSKVQLLLHYHRHLVESYLMYWQHILTNNPLICRFMSIFSKLKEKQLISNYESQFYFNVYYS